MRAIHLLPLFLLAVIARPASAEPDCGDKTCVTSKLNDDGLGASLVNHCAMPVHCQVCPTQHGEFDLSQCVDADLNKGGQRQVRFRRSANRMVVQCDDSASVAECGRAKPSVRIHEPQANPQRAHDVPSVGTGGWDGSGTGKFTLELLAVGAGTPSSGESTMGVSTSGIFWGAGIRFALQAMGAPEHPGPEDSTWMGVRFGMGLDFGASVASGTVASGAASISSSSTNFAFQVPVFVGLQWSLGSFDSPAQWTGWTIGLDYQPRFGASGSTFAPVGFNLHVASAEYEPQATASLHGHADFNFFVTAPVNAALTIGGSVGVIFQ